MKNRRQIVEFYRDRQFLYNHKKKKEKRVYNCNLNFDEFKKQIQDYFPNKEFEFKESWIESGYTAKEKSGEFGFTLCLFTTGNPPVNTFSLFFTTLEDCKETTNVEYRISTSEWEVGKEIIISELLDRLHQKFVMAAKIFEK